MFKVISMMQKKDEYTLEEFKKWAMEEHPQLGKKLPGMRHYRMSVVFKENPDLPYHAVSEFWFDDNDARLAAFGTPEGKAAAEDAAAHCASRVHLFAEEKIIIE